METLEATDLELLIQELEDQQIMCESHWDPCTQRGPHRAHWYAVSPCGSTVAVCQGRRDGMRRYGNWLCYGNTPGSGGHYEDYEDIVWTRIPHHR